MAIWEGNKKSFPSDTYLKIDIQGRFNNLRFMASVEKARKTLDKFFPPQVDAKKAVAIATRYFREFFPEAAKANMMLEEIETSRDGKHWLITLGYDTAASRRLAFEVGFVRAYKTLTVDRDKGEVLSVKIRSVA